MSLDLLTPFLIHAGHAAAVLGLAAAGLAMVADVNGQTPAENAAAVRDRFDAWAAGTGSPFELLADGATWTIEGHSAAAGTYASKEAFLTEVIRPFNARMTADIRPVVRSITAEADRVVILFDAQGTARDGKPYVNSYAWFFRMQDGRVIEATAFFDTLTFNDLWQRVAPVE